MPVLFFLFGMPLEILVIVSFYSWGMSRGYLSENDEKSSVTHLVPLQNLVCIKKSCCSSSNQNKAQGQVIYTAEDETFSVF
jgi:hypothetical protein